jgi:creatinine amidohydrolase
MLAIAPHRVDMTKAVKDYVPPDADGKKAPKLVRHPDEDGTYSPTGTWGDPTLATRRKGERLAAAVVEALAADVDALRSASPAAETS